MDAMDGPAEPGTAGGRRWSPVSVIGVAWALLAITILMAALPGRFGLLVLVVGLAALIVGVKGVVRAHRRRSAPALLAGFTCSC